MSDVQEEDDHDAPSEADKRLLKEWEALARLREMGRKDFVLIEGIRFGLLWLIGMVVTCVGGALVESRMDLSAPFVLVVLGVMLFVGLPLALWGGRMFAAWRWELNENRYHQLIVYLRNSPACRPFNTTSLADDPLSGGIVRQRSNTEGDCSSSQEIMR